MDLALLVKQDMAPKAGDPFSHAISATFIQYHTPAEVTLWVFLMMYFLIRIELNILGSPLLILIVMHFGGLLNCK